MASFKLQGSWGRMKMLVDPGRFAKALDQNIRSATQLNAMLLVGEIRKRIKSGSYTPNAALTVLIKRSSKPLVDSGDLFGAIVFKMIDSKTAFVGALRSARVGDQSAADVAAIIHEGAAIRVTPKMRGLFYSLANVGAGKKSVSELTGRAAELAQRLGSRISQMRPLKASTQVIVIPPRPFLRSVFEDKGLLKRIKSNWVRAVDGTTRAAPVPGP